MKWWDRIIVYGALGVLIVLLISVLSLLQDIRYTEGQLQKDNGRTDDELTQLQTDNKAIKDTLYTIDKNVSAIRYHQ